MSQSKELETFVRDILRNRPPGGRMITVELVEEELAAITGRDYERGIGAHFTAHELGSLLAAFSRKVPNLNRAQLRGTSAGHLHRTAAGLGARLQLLPFDDSDAEGLRGFYARRSETLRHPVIWVNSAQHQIAMAASFWHEAGHHLDAEIGGRAPALVAWSLGLDYAQHLDDPREIIADMMVCLSAYPKPLAENLFAPALRGDFQSETDAVLSAVRPHMRANAGLELSSERSSRENLQLLAGMLHFGKIRLAMLRNFAL